MIHAPEYSPPDSPAPDESITINIPMTHLSPTSEDPDRGHSSSHMSPSASRRSASRDRSPNHRRSPRVSPTDTRSRSPRNRSPNLYPPSSPSPSRRRLRRDVSGSEMPLLDNPPLAGPEIDDLDSEDDRPMRQPGVDDGLLDIDDDNDIPGTRHRDEGIPGTENYPENIPDIDDNHHPDYPPRHTPHDNGHIPHDGTGLLPEDKHPTYGTHYPHSPELGHIDPRLPTELPDVNVYQHKKTLAQGMMDLALFSANANQLRYVFETYDNHPYYILSIVLIGLSLILQVGVGVGLIWNSRYDVKREKDICIANKINNYTVICIFLITVINVFISGFGVPSVRAEVGKT